MRPEVVELMPLAPNESVITLAKQLLEGAETGQIQALAAAWESIDTQVGRQAFTESRGGGTWALVGGIAMLQANVIEALREDSSVAGDEDDPG